MEYMNMLLDQIQFEKVKTFGQLSLIPISSQIAPGLAYNTLPEVLGGELVRISELDGGASVPELTISNDSADYILLLDGEELVGAKQNRVMNTTIMVRPMSKMTIPVSCTEQGRWSYRSHNFEDSGVVMPLRSRYNKKRSIDTELGCSGAYRSNQRQVWDDIHEMTNASDTVSPTSAMKDVYKSRESSLEEFVDALRPSPGQTGMVVLIAGEVAGLEIFSRGSALQSLAPKLIRSYAMEVLLEDPSYPDSPTSESVGEFLNALRSLSSERYKSLGEGWDHRFSGDSITGSALICDDEVIHALFYNEKAAIKMNRTHRS